MPNAAMLWTGGKDSSLALYEAVASGYRVACLVTFAPPAAQFLAHPLSFITLQAQALAIPHHVLPIREPFAEGYERQLRWLRDEMHVGTVITGDIAQVNGNPNWMRERSRPVGINVHTPLWGRDRGELLRRVLDSGFEARFSCVDTRSLPQEWVGRELNLSTLEELRLTGIDLCGEQGEYHTLVTDSPQYRRPIRIRSYSRRRKDALAYMEIHEAALAA